jgi:hypothetical protein
MTMSFTDNLAELLGKYPINDKFIEDLRKFVSAYCQQAPVRAHNLDRAERRLEQAACEAIVLFWQDRFTEAWFPVTLRPGWPTATCVIKTTPKPSARLRFSFSPETDGERGGTPIEAIEFPVVLRPPNILSKAFRSIIKRDLKAEREPEPAPIGKPIDRSELVLTKAAPKTREPAPVGKPIDPAKASAKPVPSRQVPPIVKPGAKDWRKP